MTRIYRARQFPHARWVTTWGVPSVFGRPQCGEASSSSGRHEPNDLIGVVPCELPPCWVRVGRGLAGAGDAGDDGRYRGIGEQPREGKFQHVVSAVVGKAL